MPELNPYERLIVDHAKANCRRLTRKHNRIHWGKGGLTNNPSISGEIIRRYAPDFRAGKGLIYKAIETMEQVRGYLGGRIPEQIITDYLESYARGKPTITLFQMIDALPHLPWKWGDYGISYRRDLPLDFLERHIARPWNWDELSRNPVVTREFIENHLYFRTQERDGTMKTVPIPWNWWKVARIHNMTLYQLDAKLKAAAAADAAFIPLEWDFQYLSRCPYISIEFIEENIDQRALPVSRPETAPISDARHKDETWDWSHWGLSANPVITPDFVERHLDKSWTWGELSQNSSITPEFVEKHLDKDWRWGVHGLSWNPSITPEFVEKHLDKPWYWGNGGLSWNPSITPEFVEKHLDEDWDWGTYGLSRNPSITTPEFVEKHLDEDWDWGTYGLSRNPSITPELVQSTMHKPWKWGKGGLSSNPALTPELVQNTMHKPWDWEMLSGNPSITPELVQNTMHKPWKWGKGGLSSNPALTPEFIEKYIHAPWHWGKFGLSSNPSIPLWFVDKYPVSHAIPGRPAGRKLWHWGNGGLSTHPALTPDFVHKYSKSHIHARTRIRIGPKPWCWGGYGGISSNPMQICVDSWKRKRLAEAISDRIDVAIPEENATRSKSEIRCGPHVAALIAEFVM